MALSIASRQNESTLVLQDEEGKTNQCANDQEIASGRPIVPSLNGQEKLNNRTENLIRGEAQAVRFLRGAVIILLVTAATITGTFVNRLAVKNRNDAFARDFEDVAAQFILTFKGGISNQLYYSYTLSYAMGTGIYSGSKPNFPYVAIEDLDNQAFALNLQTRNQDIIWSPLLTSHTERQKWETYAKSTAAKVVADTGPIVEQEGKNWTVNDCIFRLENGTAVCDDKDLPLAPVWQISPSVAGHDAVMFNQVSVPARRSAINSMVQNKAPVLSKTIDPSVDSFYQLMRPKDTSSEILAVLFFPVLELPSSKVVGSLAVDFSWKQLLELDLTPRSEGAVIVLENTCDQVYTFTVVSGGRVNFLGEGDLHDSSFNNFARQSSFDDFVQLLGSVAPNSVDKSSDGKCAYRMRVYPSNKMRERYLTDEAWVATLVVVSIFMFTSSVFLLYDFIVHRLHTKVMEAAKRSEAIVSALFPAVVRDRIYQDEQRAQAYHPLALQVTESNFSQQSQKRHTNGLLNPKALLKSYLSHPPSFDVSCDIEPIADLFPNTTILFADIAGFTAWSSEREPPQVFKLLETLYGAFDQVATRLGVFKVETIGDCYVAVSGLPEPRLDHAVVMVEFAAECLLRMHQLTRKLEATLGPGTADLTIRIGLHSGQVTAGVLRAERARFQLFGDTMNTASRMQSNGGVNQIHVTKETADLLKEAGKFDWIEQRSEVITVKGKGKMQTYWVKPTKMHFPKSGGDSDVSSAQQENCVWGTTSVETELPRKATPSNNRNQLVEWNTDLLYKKLQKVVAKRIVSDRWKSKGRMQIPVLETGYQSNLNIHVVDEIVEAINMPDFNERMVNDEIDPVLVDLGPAVRSQLRDYVANIAASYHENAFHNFEHASHVAMSARKLLKRIIAPDSVEYQAGSGKKLKSRKILSKEIHKTTFGISSDPLMQFAIVFSALIHDVDHSGLQNRQLVKRNDPLALAYRGKCIAEQHSVRCAWNLLLEDRFNELRECIYETDDERSRFHQLVINAVIATDIADKQLQTWRKSRWDKAFHGQFIGQPPAQDSIVIDRKATIVFEYIIQASDVAHTMQHWYIYKKWNQRLFNEQYKAYLEGQEETDPSINWYEGELSFFDDYVIPLARKLKECNVFGVSCDELLTYAVANRYEWELKGKQIICDMVFNFTRA